MSSSLEYTADWCRQESQRCEVCPIRGLQSVDPDIAEHTLKIMEEFDPASVVRAVKDSESHYDSYEFEMYVTQTGDGIQSFYGTKTGYDLAKDAILGISRAHRLGR